MMASDVYTFCPRCAAPLKKVESYLLVCTGCDRQLYINPLPTNAIIITNSAEDILLVKRKFPPMEGTWDLPGGFMHPFETLEMSVQREVREELGVDVKIGRIVGVYSDTYLYQGIKNGTIGIVVTATLLSNAPLIAADDISGYQYFQKDEVLKQNIGFESMRQAIHDFITQQNTRTLS